MAQAKTRIRIGTAKFVYDKSTAGTHRYVEVDDHGEVMHMKDPRCKIGMLYIRKAGMKEPIPNLRVTLEVDG